MSADSPTSPTGSKPKSQVYNGGCHCGAVKFTVKTSPPVEDGPVTNCNCSSLLPRTAKISTKLTDRCRFNLPHQWLPDGVPT